MACPTVLLAAALALAAAEPPAKLDVFQNLDEMTRRIARREARPWQKLVREGIYQPDVLVFSDAETGAEIWSLTREACLELANIERRCPWNANGSRIALIGNRRFLDARGRPQGGAWAGHNYLMDADLTRHRKMWVSRDGQQVLMHNKFNTWDRKHPDRLYYAVDDKLWRVTLGKAQNLAEAVYTFPNARRRIIQNVSDTNLLLIQDINARSPDDPMPLFYVVDLNREPADPKFCRHHTLSYGGIQGIEGHDPKNEYRVHGIAISRDGKTVSWNYGPMTSVGEYVSFSVPADNLDARPTAWNMKRDRWGQYMSHRNTGPNGRSAYFAGPSKQIPVKGGWGLWVRSPGEKPPVWSGLSAPGGHVTWCGLDPSVFFASVSAHPRWREKRYLQHIVWCKADGTGGGVLCTPYDRRRGGKAGYDGIPRPIQSPDATKCWYHSSMLMPSNRFTGSFIAVHRRPHAPRNLGLAKGVKKVVLEWEPHPISREVRGYNVYRGDGPKTGDTLLTDQPIPGTSFVDDSATPGKLYVYMVAAQEWSGLESALKNATLLVQVTEKGPTSSPLGHPLAGWVNTPPPPVAGFRATRDADGDVALAWEASPAPDLRYYNLYYSPEAPPKPEQPRRIASLPRSITRYLDWEARGDPKGFYAITAVDRQGNESEPASLEVAPQ